jgi:hypothetical protein
VPDSLSAEKKSATRRLLFRFQPSCYFTVSNSARARAAQRRPRGRRGNAEVSGRRLASTAPYTALEWSRPHRHWRRWSGHGCRSRPHGLRSAGGIEYRPRRRTAAVSGPAQQIVSLPARNSGLMALVWEFVCNEGRLEPGVTGLIGVTDNTRPWAARLQETVRGGTVRRS